MEESTDYTEQPKKSLLNRIVTLVVPLALGVVIIYYLVKDIDPNELWAVLKDANWGVLLFSLIFGLLGNTIRGYRWRLLIKPLGYQPKVSKLCLAIFGGYAINFAIPRAGELWRCGIIAKDGDVPFTKLFGTMLIDRLMDTMTVLIITLLACAFNVKFFITQLKQNEASFDNAMDTIMSPMPYLVFFVFIATIFIAFKFFGNTKPIMKVKDLLRVIWNDAKSIWKMNEKGWLLLYTVSIWGCYFVYFYTTFFAFDFTKDLGFTAGLIAFALSSISMGIPSNGGLGPWQVAVIASLTLYGVTNVEATAFATGVFTLQSAWVIFCGLCGIAILSIKKKEKMIKQEFSEK